MAQRARVLPRSGEGPRWPGVVGADALGIADVNHNKESEYEGLWLRIPTETHHGIWAEQAASIVLAHRMIQHADHR